jgi:hypothetical protein
MRIAFYTHTIDIRGTCVAIYDYANYNEKLLNNESVIISNKSSMHDFIALKKFYNRFNVRLCNTNDEICDILHNCDVLYIIKYGKKDEQYEYIRDNVYKYDKYDNDKHSKLRIVIHCVFDMTDKHGDVYAGVSKTLSNKFNSDVFVPHMISLKRSLTNENLLKTLNIPEHALVFGRYGGYDTFDLEIGRRVISNIVSTHTDIYFLFINTPRFCINKNIIYLESITDDDEKNRFICSCDAYLEFGTLGHTFGIAMGEFSINNKPIISYRGDVWNTSHYDILKDKAIYFSTEDELYHILTTFDKAYYQSIDNNCYNDFSPYNVMNIFSKVFLEK